MTWLARWPPVLLIAVVLHTAVLPEVRVLGVAPDVLLLLAVVAGVVGGPRHGLLVGFAAGVLADLFVQTPFGLSALAYSVTGYVVGTVQGSVLRTAWWMPPATAAVASGLGVLLFALMGAVVGQDHLLTGRLPVVALVVGLAGGVLSLGALRVVRWASEESLGVVAS